MGVKYLDFEGGNDANDGLTFATRWKSVTSGATASRIAPGDEIRIMGSPDPTLVGDATWTQYSKNIVLAAPVTANICDCETAWAASANCSAVKSTGSFFKENTGGAGLSINAAFTTGKTHYFATGTLDLSAYQQVSFWIQNSVAIASASVLRLCLCSDTVGATPVHTINIPAIPSAGQWIPMTFDLGIPLSSSIQSIALYQDMDMGAVNIYLDNIIACKASSAPDSLTLTSLIGKVCNLSWAASTTYAVGDERKPTQPNRNGLRYKATTGGTTGSTEPVWPEEIGVTVADGSVVWSCVGLEDTWYGIQSINGTTVKLDNHTNCAGNAGRGYAGETGTVETYKREAIRPSTIASNFSYFATLQDSGTASLPITFSGGWNRTDMSARTGETWNDCCNGYSSGYNGNSKTYIVMDNLNTVRAYTGITADASGGWLIKNCHHSSGNIGFDMGNAGSSAPNSLVGVCSTNGGSSSLSNNRALALVRAGTFSNSLGSGISNITNTAGVIVGVDIVAKNNFSYGILTNNSCNVTPKYFGLITANNANSGIYSAGSGALLFNCSITDSTPFGGLSAPYDFYFYSQKHNQIADNHLLTTDGGTIVSTTDQRFGTEGISWKFRPTATTRNSAYPLKLSVAKIRCAANKAVSLTIPTRRDNANIKGQMVVLGGQIAGVPNDVVVDCQPSLNTWEVSSALVFTPTEDGVVEVLFRCWDGVGTTNNFWISARDLAVS